MSSVAEFQALAVRADSGASGELSGADVLRRADAEPGLSPESSSEAVDGEFRWIELSRLRPSRLNVRRSGGGAIAELADSIARVKLLQNLSVLALRDGLNFEVVAGARRWAALKLLVKRRVIAKDHLVPCRVVSAAQARTVSLTENVQRQAMSPVQELVAWKALVAEGRAVEDIAADFGVTPLVVRRRLRLANVAPRLLDDYEKGLLTLDCLMSLAIVDDHQAQEAALEGVPQWRRNAESLRRFLTQEDVDARRDGLALMVGIDAYRAAGGGFREDLFADETSGVFMTDGALLDSLARTQLQSLAEEVKTEGWGWVDIAPRVTSADLYRFEFLPTQWREPTDAESSRLRELDERQAQIDDRLDGQESDTQMPEEEERALNAERDALRREREAIDEARVAYSPEFKVLAGALINVNASGQAVVRRGMLREEGARRLRALQKERERQTAKQVLGTGGEAATTSTQEAGPPAISEKLALRLSAHRTVALQVELARRPDIALVALVDQLARRLVLRTYGRSCVHITPTMQTPHDKQAPDIDSAPAAQALQALCEAWRQRLPQDEEACFAALQSLPKTDLLDLLALCVALTVSDLSGRCDDRPAAALVRALDLDMQPWWTPTASGYFDHVRKSQILADVADFAPAEVKRLAKLTKGPLSAEAERLAAGTGWLPGMLRKPLPVTLKADDSQASGVDHDTQT